MELPLQYITFNLEGDLLALLLLVYTQLKTVIQESSTYILTYLEKTKQKQAFFNAHFKGLV